MSECTVERIRKFVTKVGDVGCLIFGLKVTKRCQQKEIKLLFGVRENIQKLSECTMSRDKKFVPKYGL